MYVVNLARAVGLAIVLTGGILLFPFQAKAQTAAPPPLNTAPIGTPWPPRDLAMKVIGCFNKGKGQVTIEDMYDCSGAWVTPKALLRCALELQNTLDPQCPALPDTMVGRSTLASVLAAENMTLSSVLQLRPADFPAVPSKVHIEECNSASSDKEGFLSCVVSKVSTPEHAKLLDCIRRAAGVAQASCLTTQLSDPGLVAMTTCLNGKQPDANLILACLNDPAAAAKADRIRKCGASAADATLAVECFSEALPHNQRQVANCLLTPAGKQDPTGCLARVSPEVASVVSVVKCTAGTGTPESKAACVTQLLPGEAGKIAGCLRKENGVEAAMCISGDKPEVKAAAQVYQCASAGRDAASLLENCTGNLGLDPKAQQTLSCAARSNGDQNKLISCAAGAVLPPEAARYAACATSSQGAASFVLCAAAPKMNEEWRIAAECAVQAGGEPISGGTCALTRLTVRELTACFKGQIGKDCFGPNNTVVVTIKNAFKDLIEGPGPNNEVVKAVAAIAEGLVHVAADAQKFLEKPLGGDKALIPKARDDLLNGLGVGGTGRKAIENPTQPWKWF